MSDRSRPSPTALAVTILAIITAGCGRSGPDSEAPGSGSTAHSVHAEMIPGTWMRSAESSAGAKSGLLFIEGGIFRVVGDLGTNGISWSLAGDTLIVTTNSERYPEPSAAARFHIAECTQSRLTLTAVPVGHFYGAAYLAGTYERDNGASALVTGSVLYRQRIALPPDAVIEVKLQDVSRMDAPATTLAEEVIPAGGRQAPFAFTLAYPTDAIDSRNTYAVSARISAGGRLHFINTTAHHVITRESPSQIEIVVEPVGR